MERADFSWIDGERLIRFGEGALAEAPRLLAERGFRAYALLTTQRALRQAPELAEGADAVLEVPPGGVPDAAAAVRDGVGGRPLVALGGGRVIDSAKAIAAADGLACAAVPTTLSGAELTRIHRMPPGVERFVPARPSLVVCDPSLMASQPVPQLAASAMNALAHGVEPLYTPLANPVADLAALRGAGLIAGALAGEGEPDRQALALGALLCSYALGSAGYAVHHVVCQTLVRTTGSPHAETNAVMLPRTVALMARRAPAVIGRLAVALGAGRDDPELAMGAVARLAARAGLTRLSQLGIDRGSLPAVAEAACARPELRNTPDPPGRDEILALLERAF